MLAEDEFGRNPAREAREVPEKKAKPGKKDVERDPRYVYIEAEGAYDKSPYLRFGRFMLRYLPMSRKKMLSTSPRASKSHVSDIPLVRHRANTVPGSDGHKGVYSYDWLKAHQNDVGRPSRTPKRGRYDNSDSSKGNFDTLPRVPRMPRPFVPCWPHENKRPTVSYEKVMADDKSLLDWLEKIYWRGFCFIEGVPVTPEATKDLIERIAFIRHTHYGGFWDFTADLTFKDTAYTNEFLGGHTDNTYFTDPARLQLFHLLSHTNGSGGENLLIDGFAAAKTLWQENKSHYQALQDTYHPWHASGNEDICIQPAQSAAVFHVNNDLSNVDQIRWNNYDRAAKSGWNVEDQVRWYEAAKHFNDILNRKNRQFWTPLEPGTALIFDNWRMLHGRSQYTGKRRMCGGYVNSDDFLSRLRVLKYGRKKVMENIGNYYKGSPNNPNLFI
ncbi:Trimethyllysine dioxygenase [Penicillium riverlandense]|uniref:Trimethyllysine dioxygenase n=1 Tax=Penicillium riverlandense TaxID=1903569 RepID=UPI0025478DE8|nr:Trimethyllysine dioxygenase [Penicillium riverlandense]KAJ5818428.1 Trimethyllysine dioxygenase [Penicillium riverlandense]